MLAGGSAFGAPVDLSAAGRDAKEPQVAFDASGKALVVWDRFNGSCAAGRPRKHQQRCTRMVARGSFTHQDAADAVKVHFSGRVQGRKLTPGRYLLALTPTANGQAGRTVRLAFRIIR